MSGQVPAARPRPPAPAKPTRARRRPALVALGLALVALSVLATVYLTTTLGETQKVLVLVNDVARGEEITSADLRVADLPLSPSDLTPVAEGLAKTVDGKRATVDLLAGQLLTPTSYAEEVGPAEGMSVVGVSLADNQMPTRTPLTSGDRVRIVETPVAGGEPPVEDPFAIDAIVRSVAPSDLGDQTVIDLEVDRADAAALAARAATGRVALILDSLADGNG
ncbi:SAF domain-containing protein [Antribacter sp. KLBMP9083]|uniref:SAF domain-containing protein n=1 Tax=Antribacter soli TaxID=2910976 RepID=A0AA41QE18_9MICO|nr:SAF domain-containing protein [Antribacter soli]MCF4120414.1 SAF domain-containing protein [Antribacter soli]